MNSKLEVFPEETQVFPFFKGQPYKRKYIIYIKMYTHIYNRELTIGMCYSISCMLARAVSESVQPNKLSLNLA